MASRRLFEIRGVLNEELHSACICAGFRTESRAFGTANSWNDDVVRPLRHLILIISLAGFAATSSAAVITAIGENATNANQWRTQTTKTINPAGNNIYGNDGYVMFSTSTVGTGTGNIAGNSNINPFTFSGTISGVSSTVTTLNVMPTYVSAFTPNSSNSSQVFDGVAAGDAAFDNPNVPRGQLASGVGFAGTGDVILGVGGASNQTLFTFTVNSKVPASFTVGLFFTDSGGNVTNAGISGGGVAVGSVTINRPNNVLDALFFRITDAAANDVYSVYVSGPGDGAALDNNIDIMGITFDSTPEPTTLAGCAAVSLVVIWLSRRRNKPGCSQGDFKRV